MKTTTIKIERPDGQIEILDVSEKFPGGLTDGMFKQIKEATAKAGKGECLSFEVVETGLSDEQMKEVREEDKKARWFIKQGFSANQLS